MANLQRTPPAKCNNSNTPSAIKRQRIDDHDDDNTNSTDANGPPVSLGGMMEIMMQQFSETRKLIDTVRSEVVGVHEKIDAIKSELKTEIQSMKNECAVKFQQHDAALESLHKRVDSVSNLIGALANRNELIISGIPSTPGENLNYTLKAIGKYLAVKDTTIQMVETRRMSSGKNSDRDGLIVVEFPLKAARDEFYSAYLRRRDLRLNHIGIDSDRRVYVNESLTSEARKLKAAALHLKKAGKLASVYTRLGIVYIKPTAGAQPLVIKTEEDLDIFS